RSWDSGTMARAWRGKDRRVTEKFYLLGDSQRSSRSRTYARRDEQSHINSKIIHPDGNVIAEAGYFSEAPVTATIDLKAATGAVAKRSTEERSTMSPWLRDGARLVEEVS